jgi:hypothetical protein
MQPVSADRAHEADDFEVGVVEAQLVGRARPVDCVRTRESCQPVE